MTDHPLFHNVTALPAFDPAIGERLKREGQLAAIENNASIVVRGRELAVEIARTKGTVCLDCVTAALVADGYGWKALGNSAGGLLSGDQRFVRTGREIRSTRPWAHRNKIAVYRLK